MFLIVQRLYRLSPYLLVLPLVAPPVLAAPVVSMARFSLCTPSNKCEARAEAVLKSAGYTIDRSSPVDGARGHKGPYAALILCQYLEGNFDIFDLVVATEGTEDQSVPDKELDYLGEKLASQKEEPVAPVDRQGRYLSFLPPKEKGGWYTLNWRDVPQYKSLNAIDIVPVSAPVDGSLSPNAEEIAGADGHWNLGGFKPGAYEARLYINVFVCGHRAIIERVHFRME